jgi:hypothetical protein
MKLTIELVPQNSWFTNLRSILSKSEWDKIRKEQYQKSNYICDICGGRGDRWPVECHEIWEYDDKKYTQKLIAFTSLCPSCHMVKHIGLAGIRGLHGEAISHLMKINNMTRNEAEMYVEDQMFKWQERSNHEWEIDISLVKIPEQCKQLAL